MRLTLLHIRKMHKSLDRAVFPILIKSVPLPVIIIIRITPGFPRKTVIKRVGGIRVEYLL